ATEEGKETVDGDEVRRAPGFLKKLLHGVLTRELPKYPWEPQDFVSGPGDADGKELREACAAWSREAHGELTRGLDEGYSGRAYGRLRWWKLLWNVDDVRCACEGVVRGYFLRDAERKGWFL